MKNLTKEKGFSIIEVVLVLAIAGLIFLMVFIALPALQRNQRDQARQTEVGTIVSAINTYMGSNNGQMPTSANRVAGIVSGNAGSNALESGTTVRLISYSTASGNVTRADTVAGTNRSVGTDEILIVTGSKCPTTLSDTAVLTAGTRRQSAVYANLEGGSLYCKTA